jgi:hypothetical protein
MERQAWRSSSLDHLRLLQQLTCVDESNARLRKRKRSISQERDEVFRNATIIDSYSSQTAIGTIHQGTTDSNRGPATTLQGQQVDPNTHVESLKVPPWQNENRGKRVRLDMYEALLIVVYRNEAHVHKRASK